MGRKSKIFVVVMLVLLLIVMFGPSPVPPQLSAVLPALEPIDSPAALKPGNGDFFLFADSSKQKTKYVILYLHGFSASPMEGDDVMQKVAKAGGFNLYAPRLYAHGLNENEPLLDFTAEKVWESAKQAYVRAKTLGDSVIIMSTSTGGTLALLLASKYPEINSLLLYSPNIDLYDSRSFLLTMPWGLQLARLVEGGKYHAFTGPAGVEKYWNTKYRLEALVNLKNMLNNTMNEYTFHKIKQPVLMVYYRKNTTQQDDVVSVDAMLKMMKTLSTPDSMKLSVDLPEVGVHALASKIYNKNTTQVVDTTLFFLKKTGIIQP